MQVKAATAPCSVQRTKGHGAVEVRARDVVVVARETQCGSQIEIGSRAPIGAQGQHLHVCLGFAKVRQNIQFMPADSSVT